MRPHTLRCSNKKSNMLDDGNQNIWISSDKRLIRFIFLLLLLFVFDTRYHYHLIMLLDLATRNSQLETQEKVEEDRYIRQKEHEEYLVRKAKEDAENAARELTAAEAAAKELHDQTTSEIFGVLSMTGDKVSDECIGNLAKWKLGN